MEKETGVGKQWPKWVCPFQCDMALIRQTNREKGKRLEPCTLFKSEEEELEILRMVMEMKAARDVKKA